MLSIASSALIFVAYSTLVAQALPAQLANFGGTYSGAVDHIYNVLDSSNDVDNLSSGQPHSGIFSADNGAFTRNLFHSKRALTGDDSSGSGVSFQDGDTINGTFEDIGTLGGSYAGGSGTFNIGGEGGTPGGEST